jgi:hypothetical protein
LVLAVCTTGAGDVRPLPNQLAGLTALSRIVPQAESARDEIRTDVVIRRMRLPAMLFSCLVAYRSCFEKSAA